MAVAYRWEIDGPQRERLLNSPCTLLARDGTPSITPYFDDARRPEPDLAVAAPPNRWRFKGFDRLEALTRARRLLGEAAPESLLTLEARMLAGCRGDESAQLEAESDHGATIETVRQAVSRCHADETSRRGALEALTEAGDL